jgi:23S rRNA pseudouridine1911/1915/1917 synthase
MSNRIKKIPSIDILYEDKDCVVIDKPAHIMVHSDGKNEGPFITDWFIKIYPKSKGVGEPSRDGKRNDIERSGVVHRLDRETSGALVLAKTDKGYQSLKKQFQDKSIKKKYLTFVWNEIKDEFGSIDRPIGRSSSDFRKWSAKRGARGEIREAETYWTRLWTGSVEEKDLAQNMQKISFLCVEPKTGRTHQIRVHLECINHPVVGDVLYSPKRPYILGINRVALHSWNIEFRDIKGKKINIYAPLPKDFVSALKKIKVDFGKVNKVVMS